MTGDPTKILVIDDSALYRQSIQNVLREVPDVVVVGWAKDGVEALDKIQELDPDLLTLDVQMPQMNGIEVLRVMKQRRLRPKAIMVSSHTSEGAKITTDALIEGAFDFILKPCGSDSGMNRRHLRESLEEKIVAYRQSNHAKSLKRTGGDEPPRAGSAGPLPTAVCRAVVLAASTGGPAALKAVLPKLTPDLAVPVLVVQHMPSQYTRSLATRLNEACPLPVVEAADGMELEIGKVFIAPGGRQLRLLGTGNGSATVVVNDDPPENGVRPAADYLLRSVADEMNGQALAVIMTGMGRDGLEGCRRLKEAGGYVFAQCQSDCVVYGMPKAVIEQDLADRVLPLGKVAPAIARHLKRSRRS